MNDNDPTRTSPPDDAATRSIPAASLPSSNATVSHMSPVPGVEATISAVGDGSAAAHSEVPEVPGYELGEEVGRGAMGVVYKARNLRLNRTVALKMVLTEQGDHRRMIRFLAEAEAVAAVKHPHVVQVFEFGEATGRPFIAFEYLSGDKLTTRLGTPLLPKDAAELLAKIARGVAAAHDQGIVHRDLKPSNILFDEENVPKVTDFGLAKRGSVSDLTATQAVMGTPAYMAPEQASGNAKFVGPQADVWALGVILYESLTGSRPFEADDVQGLLARVIMADPLSPRKRLSAIPRDVELICLKCLSKQPHERYPTAKELADDLERFGRGEPISVRPAGALGRGYKWVKRNKTVSGAMVAVVLALLVGTGVSLGFGLEAKKQADEAKKQKKEADDAAEREKGETARANREKQDAITARNELKQSNDELNLALAKSLLGPIRADASGDWDITVYELATYRRLAMRRSTPVAYHFLIECVQTPLASDQLACRANLSLHAAVGLHTEDRQKADDLLLIQLRSPTVAPKQRLALAFACSRWESVSAGTATVAMQLLLEELERSEPDVRRLLVEGVLALASRLSTPDAEAGCARAFKVVADDLDGLDVGIERQNTSLELLLKIGKRMNAVDAAKLSLPAAKWCVEGIKEEGIFEESTRTRARWFAHVLTELTALLSPTDATKILTSALTGTKVPTALNRLAHALARIPHQPDPAETANVYKHIESQWHGEITSSDDRALVDALLAVAGRLPLTEAAQLCLPTARLLVAGLSSAPPDLKGLEFWFGRLAALANRLKPAVAAKMCEPLAKQCAEALKQDGLTNRRASSEGLAELVPILGLRESKNLLVELLSATKPRTPRPGLAVAFVHVANRLEPAEAARFLTDALGTIDDSKNSELLVSTVVTVTDRLDPSVAAPLLIKALSKNVYVQDENTLAVGLAKVAGRLHPTEAATVCAPAVRLLAERNAQRLTGALAYARHNNFIRPLSFGGGSAEGLAALAGRVDPVEAVKLCAPYTKQLATASEHALGNNQTLLSLAEAFVALRDRIDPVDAAQFAQRLAEAVVVLGFSAEQEDRYVIVLSALLVRIAPTKATEFLTRALATVTDSSHQRGLVGVLANQAGRLDPPEAEKIYRAVSDILAKGVTKDAPDTPHDVEVELTLVQLLGPDKRARAQILGAHRLADLSITSLQGYPVPLAALAMGLSHDEYRTYQRSRVLQGSIPGLFGTPHNVLPSLPLLHPHFHFQPRPLPAQELVELLKHPFCVGEARRAVLDALEFTYKRPFKDQWDFVEYAQKHQPQLDLLTPPKRPEPKP